DWERIRTDPPRAGCGRTRMTTASWKPKSRLVATASSSLACGSRLVTVHDGIVEAVASTTTKAAAGSSARRAGARSAQHAACCAANAGGDVGSRPALGGRVAAGLQTRRSGASGGEILI